MTIVSTIANKNPLEEMEWPPQSTRESEMQYLGTCPFLSTCTTGHECGTGQMISVRFQGKPFSITVIQVYAPTSNAEEAEVEWFYEGPTRPSRTSTQRCPFHHRGLNAKVGSQETPGVTGKFDL